MSIDTLEALYIGQAAGHVSHPADESFTGFEAEARSTWRTVPLGVSVGLLLVISRLVANQNSRPCFKALSNDFHCTFCCGNSLRKECI